MTAPETTADELRRLERAARPASAKSLAEMDAAAADEAPPEPSLVERIVQLARARRDAEATTGFLEAARAEFNDSHAELIREEAAQRAWVASLENDLRAAVLAAYEATGDKHPAEGVGIRVVTRLEYNPEQALFWAREHGMCLALDRKAFEGLAKSKAMPIGIVKLVDEPQATISKTLPGVDQ